MAQEVDWIIEEYERAFADSRIEHDGTKRSSLGKIVERNERFFDLLDNPKVVSLLSGLLGDNYNYLGSGADMYVASGLS